MATWNGQVSASADDAKETAAGPGNVSTDASTIRTNGAGDWVGFRFVNVTVPQGATVDSAYLSPYLINPSIDDVQWTIWAQDTDDAATYQAVNFDISGRTATTASVAWSAADASGGSAGFKASPDLKAVIQEIVARPGWASGNDIAILCRRDGGDVQIRAYDGNTSQAAKLDIEYTVSAGGESKSATDGGTATEALTLYVGVAASDSASAADALGESAASTATDSASGADTLTAGAMLAAADAGAGSDVLAQLAALLLSDAGQGIDVTAQLAALASTDVGDGADSADAPLAAVAATDSGAGSDAAVLIVAVTVSDSAAGADAAPLLFVTLTVADSASAEDAASVLTALLVTATDVATGSDAVTLAAAFGLADAAAAVDAAALTVIVSATDEAFAAELVDLLTATLRQATDSATGSDGVTVTYAPLAVSDVGVGSDSAALHVAVTVSDNGSALEGVFTSLLIAVSDAATALDTVGSLTVRAAAQDAAAALEAFGLAVTALEVFDVGAGVDVAAAFDSATRIVALTFVFARRRMAFVWAGRAVDFAFARRNLAFELV